MTSKPLPVGSRVEYCLDNSQWKKLHGSLGTITDVFIHSGSVPQYSYTIRWDDNSPLVKHYGGHHYSKWFMSKCVRPIKEVFLEYSPDQQGDTEDDL